MQRPQRFTPSTPAHAHDAHFADQQAKLDPRKRTLVQAAEALQRGREKRTTK